MDRCQGAAENKGLREGGCSRYTHELAAEKKSGRQHSTE